MKRLWTPIFCSLLSIGGLVFALPAAAQSLWQDLAKFVETPSIPGDEKALAGEIRGRVKNFSPQTDHLGNVFATVGSGAPHRLIVTPLDEPGYVVSGITEDGFLRVQRLPQAPPNAVFDLLYAAQPVVIHTRKGKWVAGVAAGLSTHLQTARANPPRGAHPDEMYIDMGARSAGEVRQAGVDLLDPVVLERKLYAMGSERATAPAVGDRFGAAALVELLRRLDVGKVRGTLTVAFVTQHWAGARGLERMLQQAKPDEMIYVGRLLPWRMTLPRTGAAPGVNFPPRSLPGSGVSIGVADPQEALTGFAAELKQLGDANGVAVTPDFAAPLPRSRYTPDSTVPQRFAHLGIPAKWPVTPAEYVDLGDLQKLVALLERYAQGTASAAAPVAHAAVPPPGVPHPAKQTAPEEILRALVEVYGVSGHEGAVREAVKALLPGWAKPETDAAGNLVLHIGAAAAEASGKKAPRIAFVAHMDEIGYVVRSVSKDGTLEVQSRGGGISEFFSGHTVFVHTASGIRPGVLALPAGWDRAGFEWPRPAPRAGEAPGEGVTARVEVGANSPAEAEQLGIQAGDPITVSKKYRRLAGTRANGRSFDDRVGCASLIAAAWALGPSQPGRDVTLIWSTEEEVGLRGAAAAAQRLAEEGKAPEYVFAVDTFVSSDSPLESKRFADAAIGKGFVIRAVDNSNIAPRELVDRLAALARANNIAVQYGVTGGGNDGAVFSRYGSVDVPIGWPLRYSHSPGEVIDTRDLDALARIVAAIARSW